jgi:hypothetical protein
VREGAVRVKAVYLAIGINMAGEKEVLGLWLAQTEGAKFWLQPQTDARGVFAHRVWRRVARCCPTRVMIVWTPPCERSARWLPRWPGRRTERMASRPGSRARRFMLSRAGQVDTRLAA